MHLEIGLHRHDAGHGFDPHWLNAPGSIDPLALLYWPFGCEEPLALKSTLKQTEGDINA
jgi:hypothetical protein